MSMLKTVVIGSGAAGNKVVIKAVESGVIGIDEAVLINSTTRDITTTTIDDKELKIVNISNSVDEGGSAKEPKIGEKLTLEALKSNKLKPEDLIPLGTELVIFITSTEGGTGCGSVPLIARYVRDHLGYKVRIIAIKGFSIDARGIDNTLKFFQKLKSNFGIEIVDNSKFLTLAKQNYIEAEKLANKEICRRIATLKGKYIVQSEQNIDEKELKKIATREGYCNTEIYEIPDDKPIQNVEDFKDIMKSAIDNSKSFKGTHSQKCMGIIISIKEEEQKYIDFKFTNIFDEYGKPFEVYTHIQDSNKTKMPRFIAFMATGMNMPMVEIKNISTSFQNEFQNVAIEVDKFFDEIQSISETPSSFFDMEEDFSPNNVSKKDTDDFLNSLTQSNNKKGKDIKDIMEGNF